LEFGVLVSVEGEKLENPEKNPWSKARTNNKLDPHMTPGRNQTQATLVGGERSQHCTIQAAPPKLSLVMLEGDQNSHVKKQQGRLLGKELNS